MPKGNGRGPGKGGRNEGGRGNGTGRGQRGERCGGAGGGGRGGHRQGGHCRREGGAAGPRKAAGATALPVMLEPESEAVDDRRGAVATSTRAGLVAFIHEDQCALCGICQAVCPTGAISTDDKPVVDPAKCSGCGDCVTACPSDAIVLVKASGAGA